jgi:hypothetical protein
MQNWEWMDTLLASRCRGYYTDRRVRYIVRSGTNEFV